MIRFIRTNPAWALGIALLIAALVVRGVSTLFQNQVGTVIGLSILDATALTLLVGGITTLTVMFVIGTRQLIKDGVGAVSKVWSIFVLSTFAASAIVVLVAGYGGLKSIIQALLQWIAGNDARLNVWANPPAGPPRRGGPVNNQDSVDWIDWVTEPQHILVGVIVLGLVLMLIPEKK
mgnify:CR=1 FL=1